MDCVFLILEFKFAKLVGNSTTKENEEKKQEKKKYCKLISIIGNQQGR
jgi:hypothetical protein